MVDIQFYWIIITLICLIWATVEDLKYRLITDKIWVFQIVSGLILFIINFNSFSRGEIILIILNLLFSIIFSFAFFIFGAFGGADSKAIIALAFSSPLSYKFSLLYIDELNFFPAIIMILANMMIWFILFSLFLLVINLIQIRKYGPLFDETSGSTGQKFNVLLSSRRINPQRISMISHEDPIEKYDDGIWKFNTTLFQAPIEDEEFERIERETKQHVIDSFKISPRTYIWTRPQPPGLLFITLSYIMWVIIGSPFIILFF